MIAIVIVAMTGNGIVPVTVNVIVIEVLAVIANVIVTMLVAVVLFVQVCVWL